MSSTQIPDHLADQVWDLISERLVEFKKIGSGKSYKDNRVDLVRGLADDLGIALPSVRKVDPLTVWRSNDETFDEVHSIILETLKSHPHTIDVLRGLKSRGVSFADTPVERFLISPLPVAAFEGDAGVDIREALDLLARGKSSEAYFRAVRAVEHAAIPVILPNKKNATLGHAIGQIEDGGWCYPAARTEHGKRDFEPTSVLVGMLRSLWIGHSDRHGGPDTVVVTLDDAKAAVYLAASLIGMFTEGLVRKL